MTGFNEYWKEKAQKRRKAWAAKAKRFADRHAQLEDIRKEVYLPLDFGVNFSLEDYKPGHFIKLNPLISWQDMNFCFSEEGLRAALEAEGADMSSFKMEVSHQTIKGLEAPQPKNRWETYSYMPNKVFDYEKIYLDWLQRMYEICTDMETVSLSYRQITMTIKRYSTEGMPFGYYEVNPCEQLTKSAMLMQETDFYTLNVATLLMEAAAEWELRQEELNYYAKKLKIRTMEAAISDSIEFELWDDKKLQKKIQEYIEKDYQLDKILEQVLRPWKMAIKKYIDAATERTLKEQVQTFEHFNHWNKDLFWEKELVPYLNSLGLQDMEINASEDKMNIAIKTEGFQCSIISAYYGIYLYPNSHYERCQIEILPKTPLSAIGEYLKMMPRLSQKMEETLITTMHIHDQQMMQKPEYRHFVEIMEPLAVQNAGKPVGKLLKYMRWEAGRLYTTKILSSAIKITSDTRFCYVVRDEVREQYVDAECHNVFVFDPVTTDVDAWIAANRHGIGTPRYKLTVGDFVRSFMSSNSNLFISIDFVDQKL